jgi:hypothetical protein
MATMGITKQAVSVRQTARLFGIVALLLVVAADIALLWSTHQDGLTTVMIIGLTFAAVTFARAQLHMMHLQIRQAEEIADRKDEALIIAIESLTLELKRRPAPNPAEIHLSLFGVKK